MCPMPHFLFMRQIWSKNPQDWLADDSNSIFILGYLFPVHLLYNDEIMREAFGGETPALAISKRLSATDGQLRQQSTHVLPICSLLRSSRSKITFSLFFICFSLGSHAIGKTTWLVDHCSCTVVLYIKASRSRAKTPYCWTRWLMVTQSCTGHHSRKENVVKSRTK